MKNNYSIAQRNAIVEANLWCIDSVIRQNRPLMRAARLEYDDVYQQLALRLIKAVAGYDPEKGRLEQHIFAQLKYELLSCKSAYRLCGMTGAPHSFRKSHIISIDTIRSLGVREVVEAMDMDQMTNPNVRSAILTMRKEVRKIPGIRYSKYTWNPAYKGVDDYLLSQAATM